MDRQCFGYWFPSRIRMPRILPIKAVVIDRRSIAGKPDQPHGLNRQQELTRYPMDICRRNLLVARMVKSGLKCESCRQRAVLESRMGTAPAQDVVRKSYVKSSRCPLVMHRTNRVGCSIRRSLGLRP